MRTTPPASTPAVQGPLHTSFDTPADAPLVRAIAHDVEEPESGYVFGGITAARLRKLADVIEHPAIATLIDTLNARTSEVELRFVEQPTGTYPAIPLAEGTILLAALVATEPPRGAR